MQIHFLGTSAGVPTLKRGLPAVALEREGELFLFDCGEGTQMALQRSAAKAYRLAGVFISHLHGDHLLGLPGLLMSLQMAGRDEPLAIVGPGGLGDWLRATFRLVSARIALPLIMTEIDKASMVFDHPEYEIRAEPVEHRVMTFGFSFVEKTRPGKFDIESAEALGIPKGPLYGKLQHGETVKLSDGREIRPDQVLGPPRKGRKVAYVTDTRPCLGSERLAAECDLLIHEATFDADRAAEAADKGHSSLADAVAVARNSGARRLALTHFSPRYEKMTEYKRQLNRLMPDALLAEDGMTLALDREGEIVSVSYDKRSRPVKFASDRSANGDASSLRGAAVDLAGREAEAESPISAGEIHGVECVDGGA